MNPAIEMTRETPKPDAPSDRGLPRLVDAMMGPDFYPDSPARVELKQTHISYVFVAGDSVYKIKKPVHFPFSIVRISRIGSVTAARRCA